MATGDEIKAWMKAAAEMPPEPITDCPICGWTLEKMKDGRVHCPFCGWISS